jgi:glycosyltransferase involved in cell wall biosynthesis
VPFTYPPDAAAGTEVYVSSLAAALLPHAIDSAVAAPGGAEAAYDEGGTSVFRFPTAAELTLSQVYGAPDESAARSFRRVLARARPDIVHLHARTAAVSERLADMAHDAGARVVFTYHTATASCVRGTLRRWGREVCDGALEVRRCGACVLQRHGVPRLVCEPLAAVPVAVGRVIARMGFTGAPATALRMSALVSAHHRHFRELVNKADRVVATSAWVVDLLRLTGIDEARLTLCRPGVRAGLSAGDRRERPAGHVLRIGYFGRVDRTKGVDLLAAALARDPDAPVQIDVYGIRQPGSAEYAAQLERASATDPRLKILSALPSDEVVHAMGGYDCVAVSSRSLETGPLVVLEAFAAGTPVIGSRLGGIADLITHDVNGLLVAPDDPAAWAEAIGKLARNPNDVTRLRAGVRPPRDMDDVAGEMARLYRSLVLQ